MKIYFAPLQGYTEAPYRHFHNALYKGVDVYCAPFVHPEGGEGRRKDIRDIASPLNRGVTTLPQIIFRDCEEMRILTDEVRRCGYKYVDLNMGCPFVPQVRRGRGSGFLVSVEELKRVAEVVSALPDISFSIKMRLGADSPDEWRQILPIVNDMPLHHVTVHPRTGRQQYKGDLHMTEFEGLLESIAHPVIYNGDIRTADDIRCISVRYPSLYGVMAGRGMLARPSLAEEYLSGTCCDNASRLLALHEAIFKYYSEILCGEAQILSKMKPFWEYPAGHLPHRCVKAIRKAKTMETYLAAVGGIGL